jgi:hypothetical protein
MILLAIAIVLTSGWAAGLPPVRCLPTDVGWHGQTPEKQRAPGRSRRWRPRPPWNRRSISLMPRIARAHGVAEANKIIGNSLKGNEAYLRYLWIHNLAESKGDVIYVPTEAGLPILEAGRRPAPKEPEGGQ